MNSILSPLFLIQFLSLSLGLSSCFTIECHESDCPKDVKIPPFIEELAPYKANDKVSFVSSTFDTVTFICITREIYEETGYPDIEGPDDCCKLYSIEGFKCTFEGDQMRVNNSNYGYNYLGYYLIVENDTVSANFTLPYTKKLGDRTIAGQLFSNVEVPDNDSTVFLVRNPALGIVGFLANGKEWRTQF
jgi:hypothetical protein